METPAAPYCPEGAAGFADAVTAGRTAGIGFDGIFRIVVADADALGSGGGVNGASLATGGSGDAAMDGGGGGGGATIPVVGVVSGARFDAMTTAPPASAAAARITATIATGIFDLPGAV